MIGVEWGYNGNYSSHSSVLSSHWIDGLLYRVHTALVRNISLCIS